MTLEINVNNLTEDFYTWFYKLPLQARQRGNGGGRNKKDYIDIISAFDIETTRINSDTKADRDKRKNAGMDQLSDYAVMYIWQWCFMDYDYNYVCIYGRTWAEFIQFYRKLLRYCDSNTFLVVYVHNLAYEFQFLRGIMPFGQDDVFNIKPRQPLKAVSGHIEFRCSYKLTNMSLRKFAESMHCKYQKTELYYEGKRYDYTELTSQELRYCLNDVICLCEAIIHKLQNDGDSLYTIPLTSTGYVRREVKRAVHAHPAVQKHIRQMFPDIVIYGLLKEAFRGGNTHANRYYSNKLLDAKDYGLIHSADRSSSYPAVICNNKYPMSEFSPVLDTSLKNVTHLITDMNRAILTRVKLYDVHLNNVLWGCPYLSQSKCRNIINGRYDNGRVLSANYLETTITDVDFYIIQKEYDCRIEIFDCYSASYGKLPDCIIGEVIKYYKNKTTLKGVAGQEYFYIKSKNLLNSVYGMMVQDPCKDLILYINGDTRHMCGNYQLEGQDKIELLEKAHKKVFLNYAWGIWVTAWARYELERGIEIAGDGFLYCDTDSVKYIGCADFSEYNQEKVEESLQSGSYATDSHNNIHYMGVFESENDMTAFKTMGAKKYAYEDKNGLHITVAGVGKKSGVQELQRAADQAGRRGIELFNEGFCFSGDAGGLEAVYNDIAYGDYIKTTDSNGKECLITSNVCLRTTTYTLGLTNEYRDLLFETEYQNIDDKVD